MKDYKFIRDKDVRDNNLVSNPTYPVNPNKILGILEIYSLIKGTGHLSIDFEGLKNEFAKEAWLSGDACV